ncbi:MAG TPA: NAD(P)H-dependent oxidoreductase [Rhizomicrobium sp.]|nr:NAD(P)H-dependent oxidoreductase [Rhizomicrobium sp.]
MKHAIIFAHPKAESFTGAMAAAYRQAAEARGDEVAFRDLYRDGFDPRLAEDEFPWSPGFKVHDDVAAEREALAGTDIFALFYPLWLNAPPAMMKGYLERVFGLGFAYRHGRGGNEPLLAGRKLISVTSTGAPTEWVIRTGAWQALRTLFDAHFASVCGLEVMDHLHFGGIVPGIRAGVVAQYAKKVRDRVATIPAG